MALNNEQVSKLFQEAIQTLTDLPQNPHFEANCQAFQAQFAGHPEQITQLQSVCSTLTDGLTNAGVQQINHSDDTKNGFAIALMLFVLIFAIPWKCGSRGGKRRKTKQNKKRRTVKRR